MAVVMKKQIGKCTAIIDDSHITDNEAEIDIILDNIYNIFLQSEYSMSKETQKNETNNQEKA